jgi:hypothetical protein
MVSKSYSKGISWIDDCRIGFEDRQNQQKIFANGNGGVYKQSNTSKDEYVSVKGRFPANLLVSDDMLNDGVITKQSQRTYKPTDKTASLFGNSPQAHGIGIGDKGTNSRYYDIDRWFNNLIDV